MMHISFTLRQLSRSFRQATVFILCVGLSICCITAFSGFSESINRSVLNDARKFHAADIIIRSGSNISDRLEKALEDLIGKGRIERARVYELYSVVRAANDNTSVLADVKIVEKNYPFYGNVTLKSGRPFHDILKPESTVVEQSLLDRLGIRVGDTLNVGLATLTIQDVVTAEPDRPVEVFSFGPRVFVADGDRDALGLIQKGSRVSHIQLIKVLDDANMNTLSSQLKDIADADQERIDTFQTANSRFKRFLDNFLFFLKLVGFFIMVISGFGIQVTLTAFLNERKNSIAIMKTVGATNHYITRHFMLIVCMLGFAGILLGLVAGYMVQLGLARMLVMFLPENLQMSVSWTGVIKGILLGISVVIMFTFLPLYRIKYTRPVMILRKDVAETPPKWPLMVSGFIFLTFFSGLVFWHMRDVIFSLYFIGGMGVLILITFLFTQAVLFVLKRTHIQRLSVRQAAKGLFRRDNATAPIVIALTASLSVIFTIYLMERNLNASFIQSYPPEAPNVFFLDIQPSQIKEFKQLIGQNITVYPVVRARVLSINGEAVDRQKEHQRRGDNFSREFNLTYRDDLLENEKIIEGRGLFRNDWKDPQVSILDIVVDMRQMGIGDSIGFNIQGVPLEARISSIRTQEMESMSPFFYFVFPEKILKEAPQTIFAALKVEHDRISALQNKMVSRFPNISVIDVTETIKSFSKLMDQLSNIIGVFTLLSITAGILILISAIFATRAERIAESVYYKVLGARKIFIFQVFSLENFLIGLMSGVLALIMAQTTAIMICKYTLDISYHFFFSSVVLIMIAAILLVVVVGIVMSRSILDKKPISFLNEQPDG